MAKTDLSKLSLDELKQLQRDAAKRIKEIEREEKKKVLAKMQELAASAGMTPSEVAAHFGTSGRRRSKGTPKYHNPDNPGQTWTGKGRKPGWLQALIDNGGKLEDYEIRS